MSAAPWTVETPQSSRTRNRKTKGSAKVVSRSETGQLMMKYAAVMVAVFMLTYGLSSLIGHSTRQAAFSQREMAQSRIDIAKREVILLQEQVAQLASPSQIGEWADRNGMLQPSGLARLEEMNAESFEQFGSITE